MKTSSVILLYFLLAILSTNTSYGQATVSFDSVVVKLSDDEIKLYQLINEYREKKNLKKIPLSKALCYVAQQHCIDLSLNNPDAKKRCNMHSWSNKGNWSACCYTSNHKKATCVWDKPRELTDYTGNGYEIAYWSSKSELIAPKALDAWKKSKGHNATIINRKIWKNHEWNAIGVGIVDGYATVWFGKELDKNTVVID